MLSVLLASANHATSGTAALGEPPLSRYGQAKAAIFRLSVTGRDGTNPTLDAWIQTEIASGAWLDVIAFARVTEEGDWIAAWTSRVAPTAALRALVDGAMTAGVQHGPLPSGAWRIKWAIAGTDGPTFEFSLFGEWQN